METEYVEEARNGLIKFHASGTGHVQDNGGKNLAVCRRAFGQLGCTRHDHLKIDLMTDVSHSH